MKKIQSALHKWMKDNESFKENYTNMKQNVLNDPEIKQFLDGHPELSDAVIEKNLIKLYEFSTQSKQCDRCSSFGSCINIIKGYSPVLHVDQGDIHLSYEKCHSMLAHERTAKQQQLIQSLYVPKEILSASVDDLDPDATRSEAITAALTFLNKAKTELPSKGIFFSGPFGVGKTYFLGAVANKLKDIGISSMLIYMPEFVREMKTSIKDDSINEKIEHFKKADVLMLDDIGAETQSAWFRDEILGSILQYRMMERLPVFFTSNYTLKQLQEQLAFSNRGGVEEVKAGRVIERIRQVSREVEIYGPNRREE
ncbi:Primosomal protein DnaI [Lentibacillus sp. JNUCC-1]|uniref:primosomal protein DnaI n=1 Tax=Lentibacillus sp. JNUCC-1 TaxID=2654513 RepID=UPI0012E7B0B5|nr:primosomal protein DnaI [Lentibacillus sp. JNUCC-1]MUV39357.1 Primosomal protein DnaI [Lentibacillus sp. JNUCC-1]